MISIFCAAVLGGTVEQRSSRHGHQFQHLTIGIPEVNPAAAIPIVELAVAMRRNALRLLRPTDCRHAAIVSFLVSNQETRLQAMSGKMNSTHMIGFKESMN
jgi:hypothetical protein